ncbi:TrbC family F-type conjugative pilus assembly protein [Providencia huaxiensis]|uniref:TrbC family F-type conjugative pilus assembly protein n=1 Tax=Providencia huaxiensis TaxID=2027290 RepID=UPI0034DCEEDD
MRSVSGRNDVILVVQGVKNKTLVDEINHWHKLIRDTKSEVNFTINTNIFIKYGVRTIPTIIHENDSNLYLWYMEFPMLIISITKQGIWVCKDQLLR